MEVECYNFSRTKGEVLDKNHSVRVSPGNSADIYFLGRNITVTVSCSLDFNGGLITVSDLEKKAKVVSFENEDDKEGKDVCVDSEIRVEGKQGTSITAGKKHIKEMIIYVSPDKDSDQLVFQGGPTDDMPTPKIPAGVN